MKSKRKTTLILAAIVLIIYLGFQLILIQSVSVAQYDESIYLDVARNVSRTGLPIRSIGEGQLLLDQTPLYPYLLGALSLVFNENILLLRLITVGFGAGGVLLAFVVGTTTRGALAGFVSGLILALSPFFGHYSFFIRMEVFMCFFLLLATYYLVRREEYGSGKYLIGASLAILIAVLFKVVAVTYWAASILYVFIWTKNWHQRMVDVLWLGVPTALGIVSWLLFSLLEPGQFETRVARWRGAISGGGIIVDPRLRIADLAWLRTVGELVLGWEIVALFTFCLLVHFLMRRGQLRITMLLLFYLAFTIAASLLTKLKEPRHVIGLIPIMAVAIGLMVNWSVMGTWLQQRRVLLVTTLIGAFLFAWSLSPLKLPPPDVWQNAENWWESLYAGRVFHNDRNLEPLRDVGEYLAQHSSPETMIVVIRQGPVVGYYADRSYIILYTRPFDENMEILRNSELVVVDRIEFWRQTPDETDQLMQYIKEHFAVEAVVTNPNRDILLYRREG